jgi:hypothetical protein
MQPIKWILLLFIALTSTAQAKDILAGPEWEVTNGVLMRGDPWMDAEEASVWTVSDANEAGRDRLTNMIWSRCPNCIFEEKANKFGTPIYKVTFPELGHWYAIINVDPGTVEIQAKPLTVDEWRRYADKIQYYIFDSARAVKLEARWDLRSAAHIHFGLQSTFEGDRLLFRNFVVSFMNHPELAQGIMEYDIGNAPSLFSVAQVEAFRALLAEFDRGQMSIETFAERMVREVQIDNPAGWDPFGKFQSLSFLRIIDPQIPAAQKTVEVRSLRAQRNMREFILVLDFFQTWIDHLDTLKAPVELNTTLDPLTPEQAEARYKALVKEIGGSWSKYKKIMPKYMPDSPVGEEFIYSEKDQLKAAVEDRKVETDPVIITARKVAGRCMDIFKVQMPDISTAKRY